ncbi:MAG: phosphotransferase [Acidimicrobiales bacterium]|jgi:hypothetical protein|nr:phosphotransferase [Acidimicrobiales bacterium]HJM97368.1 phosphotransferase [Acidimicrobiales bacterium]
MVIPLNLSEITPDWLQQAFRSSDEFADVEVEDITCENIGEGTGIFGEIGLLSISYSSQGEAPDSLVVKLPCVEPENLAIAQALGIYAREVAFYRTVSVTSVLRVPKCFYSQMDEDGRFVLLIEDLSLDYTVGDQIEGATHEQVLNAIDALAQLHADWWENPELESLDWLPLPDDPAYMAAVPEIYRGGVPVLVNEWVGKIPDESIKIAQALEPRFEELMFKFAGGPHTLSHADTRLDNLFFSKTGSSEVAFIDFQLCLRARGINDIAYLVGNSVPQEIASTNWESYIQHWINALKTHGVEYDFDDAVDHYRQAVLYYTVGAMSLIASFDTGNERGAAMAEAYVTRIFTHVVDIGAGVVLEG